MTVRSASRKLSASAACLVFLAFAAMFSPAIADWREELGVFRVALVTSDNEADSRAALEPFRLVVQEKLGLQA